VRTFVGLVMKVVGGVLGVPESEGGYLSMLIDIHLNSK